jgi:tRNA threonylcarbamoyladenosine biosynthesis protein TsaE
MTDAAPISLTVPAAEHMRDLGRRLAGHLRPGDLVLLHGALGAGKTTFAQGVGAGLGVRGAVTSPTFVIARVHPSEVGGPALVHVDAYRLGSLEEVDDLDLDASVADSVTLVEWGEGKAETLSPDRLDVRIERTVGDQDEAVDPAGYEARVVTLAGVGGRWSSVDLRALASTVGEGT